MKDKKIIKAKNQTISLSKGGSWFKKFLKIINANTFFEGDVRGNMGIKIDNLKESSFEITKAEIPKQSYALILDFIDKNSSDRLEEFTFEFWWDYVDAFEDWHRYYKYSLSFVLNIGANTIELVAAEGAAYEATAVEERCPACDSLHLDYFDEESGVCGNCGYQGKDLHLFLLRRTEKKD